MTAEVATTPAVVMPEWLEEVSVRLATVSQVVLVGAPNETHFLAGRRERWVTSERLVAEQLVGQGYQAVARWSYDDGLLGLHEGTPGLTHQAFGGGVQAEPVTDPGERGVSLLETLVAMTAYEGSAAATRVALLVTGAEHTAETYRMPPLLDAYATAQTLARASKAQACGDGRELHNAVVWFVDREHDLPPWLLATRGVHVVSIPLPDSATRRALGRHLLPSFQGGRELDAGDTGTEANRLGDLCEGMSQAQMRQVGQFAQDRRLALGQMEDAVRGVRSGLASNPWRSTDVSGRLRRMNEVLVHGAPPEPGEAIRLVRGQPRAVQHAVDVVGRAWLGLSDWDDREGSSRPRGVLFFAGPTGVGKTHLASQLAVGLFGRQEAMVRFDMSEYTTSHSAARLIGSPPGYVGHEAGGQLTNAVRQQPFSLLLFDEIDKADPEILDTFLQILEDGRLTDGSGSTVYFGETLIVFTSNLGIYERSKDRSVRATRVVQPGTDYETLQRQVTDSVKRFFTEELQRPELLNRIGDNIIVFDFLRPEVARQLLEEKLGRIVRVVRERAGVELTFADEARSALQERFLSGGYMEYGGRGVHNLVESVVVNGVARQVLSVRLDPPGRERPLHVAGLSTEGLVWG